MKRYASPVIIEVILISNSTKYDKNQCVFQPRPTPVKSLPKLLAQAAVSVVVPSSSPTSTTRSPQMNLASTRERNDSIISYIKI